MPGPRPIDDAERARINRRLDQIGEGIKEAIAREVAWLKAHDFPVWVMRDGKVVDASKDDDADAPRAD